MKKYLKLLRVKNYIKNLLILLPVLFGQRLFDTAILPNMIWSFVAFSSLSSAVYIFNDLCDCKRDVNHPVKCKRPIASGEVSKKTASLLIATLIVICIITNYFACGLNDEAWALLLLYLIQNILYSLILKKAPIIDIAIIAFGFLIRVFYGSAISGVHVSKWLYLTIIAISFYIGFGKRRNELAMAKKNDTRPVLEHYTYDFLDKNMYVCSALTIVFYSLWSVSDTTMTHLGKNTLIWTVPLVILICIAYSLSVEKSNVDDPVDILFENKFLLALIVVYGLSVIDIVYLNYFTKLFMN